jgi:hypothetical protein
MGTASALLSHPHFFGSVEEHMPIRPYHPFKRQSWNSRSVPIKIVGLDPFGDNDASTGLRVFSPSSAEALLPSKQTQA